MKKPCFICQPFGIGDILFIQKIIRHCAAQGLRVIVPLRPDLRWLRYHLLPHPDIEYPLLKEVNGRYQGDFEFSETFLELWRMSEHNLEDERFNYPLSNNDFMFLGLAALWKRLPNNLMPGKYEFAGIDYKDWTKHVFLKRRPHVERELFYDVLGLKDGERFTLVNQYCSGGKLDFNVPGNIVNMQEIDGFTPIDWFLTIERAAQIVTIDTSLVLLVEILGRQKPLYMISRYTPPSFKELEDILTLKWNLVPLPGDLRVEAA